MSPSTAATYGGIAVSICGVVLIVAAGFHFRAIKGIYLRILAKFRRRARDSSKEAEQWDTLGSRGTSTEPLSISSSPQPHFVPQAGAYDVSINIVSHVQPALPPLQPNRRPPSGMLFGGASSARVPLPRLEPNRRPPTVHLANDDEPPTPPEKDYKLETEHKLDASHTSKLETDHKLEADHQPETDHTLEMGPKQEMDPEQEMDHKGEMDHKQETDHKQGIGHEQEMDLKQESGHEQETDPKHELGDETLPRAASPPRPVSIAMPKPVRPDTLRQSTLSTYTSASTALSDMTLLRPYDGGARALSQIQMLRAVAYAKLDAAVSPPPLPPLPPLPSLPPILPSRKLSIPTSMLPQSPSSSDSPASSYSLGSPRSHMGMRKPVPPLDLSDGASSIWTHRDSTASSTAGWRSAVPSSPASQMYPTYRAHDSARSEWTWTRPLEDWEKEQLNRKASTELLGGAGTRMSAPTAPAASTSVEDGESRGESEIRHQSSSNVREMRFARDLIPILPLRVKKYVQQQ